MATTHRIAPVTARSHGHDGSRSVAATRSVSDRYLITAMSSPPATRAVTTAAAAHPGVEPATAAQTSTAHSSANPRIARRTAVSGVGSSPASLMPRRMSPLTNRASRKTCQRSKSCVHACPAPSSPATPATTSTAAATRPARSRSGAAPVHRLMAAAAPITTLAKMPSSAQGDPVRAAARAPHQTPSTMAPRATPARSSVEREGIRRPPVEVARDHEVGVPGLRRPRLADEHHGRRALCA